VSLRREALPRDDVVAEALMAHAHWGADQLWQRLEPLLPGLTVEVVARADSTNTQLIARARVQQHRGNGGFGRRAGDTQPYLLVAEHQIAGRGRMGRAWKSLPEGSLTFSLAYALQNEDWSGLSLAVGVAVAEALDLGDAADAPARVLLKWPNDLMLRDADGVTLRKLGGILIESVVIGTRRLAIIGIGINVEPQDLGELSNGYACMRELQPDATPPGVLAQIAPALARAITDFERAGFAAFAERYAARDGLKGRRVELSVDGIAGIVSGVAADGSLCLTGDDGIARTALSGDVSVRLASAG
jgi:BirA family biotin operon repressor/biotin-[acetyl-CoA-carboxylase] ligase